MTRWQSSAQKLRQTKYLALMAMFIAMKIVLGRVSVPVGENLHAGVSFLAIAVEASIIGPAAALVSGAVTDLVSFMIFPNGPFFFGYSLTAMLGVFFYSLFFYEKKITIQRIVLAKLVTSYGVNVLLGSLWSAILYSKGYYYYFVKSLIKNSILFPLEVLAITAVFNLFIPFLKKKNLIAAENSVPLKWH